MKNVMLHCCSRYWYKTVFRCLVSSIKPSPVSHCLHDDVSSC